MKEKTKAKLEDNGFLKEVDSQLGGNMPSETTNTLKKKLGEEGYQKIAKINNPIHI